MTMAAVLVPLILAAAPQAAPATAPDRRAALESAGHAFERALHSVGASAAAYVWSSGPRGYHVPGMGAVFTLTPRRLTVRRVHGSSAEAARAMAEASARLESSLKHERSQAVRAELRRSLEALRRSRAALEAASEADGDPGLVLMSEPAGAVAMTRDIAVLQRQAEAFRRQAEEAWAEAERAVETAVAPAPPVPPAPPAPPAAHAAPHPPALPALPTPMLVFPDLSDEPLAPEAETALLESVRAAVVPALEGAAVESLRLPGDESLVVVVDFLPRRAFWVAARPQRTVVVRVRQKDVDGRRAGKLSAEDLKKRLEVDVY
jgi:hypothetical protein